MKKRLDRTKLWILALLVGLLLAPLAVYAQEAGAAATTATAAEATSPSGLALGVYVSGLVVVLLVGRFVLWRREGHTPNTNGE